jgi:hypothetical protein
MLRTVVGHNHDVDLASALEAAFAARGLVETCFLLGRRDP